MEAEFQDLGRQFTNDLSLILNDSDIQLVTLCTPPNTHYDLVKHFLQKGKHLIIESLFAKQLQKLKAYSILQKNLLAIPFQKADKIKEAPDGNK